MLGARSDRHRRVEELIDELRQNYTIVIVTHSMQQAARVSQRTAMFHLGYLVEEGPTDKMFTNPREQAHAGLHHRPLRLRGPQNGTSTSSPPSTRTSQALARSIAEMGGRAEDMVERSITALAYVRCGPRATQVIEADHRVDQLQRQIEEAAIT